ncbi:hypothetical protein SELMODRAFT_49730, partial [Selaginella moellendorffii]
FLAVALDERTWCIAKPDSPDEALQKALDYACGQPMVNCLQIQPGNGCYSPVNLHSHSSFAMNLYYQGYGKNSWNCNFSGIGILTTADPSK